MENPSESSKQESNIREEASSEEDSTNISSALGSETKIVKTLWMKGPSSLEKANMSIFLGLLPLFLRFVLHLSLSFAFFIFPYLIFSIFSSFIEVNFSNRGSDRRAL